MSVLGVYASFFLHFMVWHVDATFLAPRQSNESKKHIYKMHLGTTTVKSQYPYYHTSEELSLELRRLAGACGGMMQVNAATNDDLSMDVVTLKAENGTDPANRAFFISGEHARELIGPETVLHFLKLLCGEVSSPKRDAATALANTEFMFLVNANPLSRLKVENGDYCLRANPNNVDLNRNWDEHWQSETVGPLDSLTNGRSAFSEKETQLAKKLVTEFKPTSFLSVHSGTLGLYMPWAFEYDASGSLASTNQAAMMEILEEVDAGHCECPYGAAQKEVGYPCPGTSVDYVYDKLSTPFSYAFEIWGNPMESDSLKRRWEEKKRQAESMMLLQTNLSHGHFSDFFHQFRSDFVGASQMHDTHQSAQKEMCFLSFNPNTQESYDHTVQNWAEAFFDMSELIAAKLQSTPLPL